MGNGISARTWHPAKKDGFCEMKERRKIGMTQFLQTSQYGHIGALKSLQSNA
jgi:hypothetical protein